MTGAPPRTSIGIPAILWSAVLVYLIFIGGSEVGAFAVPLQIANAVLASVVIGIWIGSLRRGADRVDGLVIAGLLGFLLACVAGAFPRQSYDAAMAALAWTAAFGVARRLLAEPRHRLLVIRLLSVCGMLFALAFAVSWGGVWLAWIRLTNEPPPLDLVLPAHIYRHYYAVAMLMAGLLPASVWLLRDKAFRVPAALAVAMTLALVVMSGSRTVWLALLVAGGACLFVLRPSTRSIAIGAVVGSVALVIAVATGWLPAMADRLVAAGTVGYRLDVWRETLQLFANDPLTGIGPGSFGIGITLTELMSSYQFTNRHPDSALIQLAGEGGLVGLMGAVLVMLGVIVGRRFELSGAHVGFFGLVILLVCSVTNDATYSPNLIAITVVYAALLAPLDRERCVVPRAPRLVRAATVAAAGLAASAAMAFGVASIAHQAATSAAAAGSWMEATHRISMSVALDPAMALYRREYGVLLAATGRDRSALRELKRATELNPADSAALRAFAVVTATSTVGVGTDAQRAADRAAQLRPLDAENWLTMPMAQQGDDAADAVVEALRVTPWLTGSSRWDDPLPMGTQLARILELAAARVTTDPAPRGGLSAAWLRGVTDIPAANGEFVRDGLTAVLRCDLDAAQQAFHAMGLHWSRTTGGIAGRLILARLVSDPNESRLLEIAALAQPNLAAAARGHASAYSLFADPIADAQLYRRLGLGQWTPGPVVPRSSDALGAWIVDPVGAAFRGAPAAPLADCA